MKNKTYLTVVLTSILLISCQFSVDYIYPAGYPFEGNIHELNYRLSTKLPKDRYRGYIDNQLFTNKQHCDSVVKTIDTKCNCDEVDFTKEYLYKKRNISSQVYYGHFNVRLLINHNNKTIGLETNLEYTSGNSGLNSSYTNVVYDEWLIIPHPPIGYSFKDTFSYE